MALPVHEIGLIAIEVDANPNVREGTAVGGRGWYHSKERCRVPIGPP